MKRIRIDFSYIMEVTAIVMVAIALFLFTVFAVYTGISSLVHSSASAVYIAVVSFILFALEAVVTFTLVSLVRELI